MRRLFCPICAGRIEWRINEFKCVATGAVFSAQLGNAIKNAVYSVDAPRTGPRAPVEAPYLWCPSCTAEMDGYDGWLATIRLAGVLPHEGMLPVGLLSFRLVLFQFHGRRLWACGRRLRRWATLPRSGALSTVAARCAARRIDRGRDARYRAPPAQSRTCPIRAFGSYLGCLTAKRWFGHG